MTEFTKEQLAYWSQTQPLAAFALAQMERAEADQRELIERGKDIHTLTCALESERLRAEKAEARKTAKEILDAGGEWRELTDREVELLMLATMPDLLSEDQQAGRDRLSRLVCTTHSLLTARRSAEAERDRLREKGAWLQAEVDVLRGKACDEEQAAGNGPCGVCRNCAWAERNRIKGELEEAEEAIRDLTDSGDAMRFSMPTAAMAGKAGWDASRRHAAVRRALERGK